MWTISGRYNGKLPASETANDEEGEEKEGKGKKKKKEKMEKEENEKGSKEGKEGDGKREGKQKSLHFSGVNMIYFKDDKIIEQIISWDAIALINKLGLRLPHEWT